MKNDTVSRKPSLLRAAMVVSALWGAAALGFASGMLYTQLRYDDICLDLGGGREPGGHAICVVEMGDEVVTEP